MGPFKAIASFSDGQKWAHTMLSPAYLMGYNGPIQGYRQLFSWAAMGPYNAIASFSDGQQWAHTMLSPAFLMGSNGPIQGYRQLF